MFKLQARSLSDPRSFISRVFKKRMTRRQFIQHGVRAGVALTLAKGVYNTTRFHLDNSEITITIPRLPGAFRGLKIALMGDFHSSPLVSRGQLDHAVEMVNKARPDIIALVGDFVSDAIKPYKGSSFELRDKYLHRVADALSVLSAPLGIYGVLGNHDFWYGADGLRKLTSVLSEKVGVEWLRNENRIITRGGEKIALLGVDDFWEDSCSFPDAYKGIEDDTASILLSHNPEINYAVEAYRKKIDLILAGHTHGGQIYIPFIGAPYIVLANWRKYMYGLEKDGQRQTFVTRGVGHLMSVPIRLNCPSEVNIITLM